MVVMEGRAKSGNSWLLTSAVFKWAGNRKSVSTDVKTPDSGQLFGTQEMAIDYYDVYEEEDPFPDALGLQFLDVEKRFETGSTKMLQISSDNELPTESKDELWHLATNIIDAFRTSFGLILPLKSSCYVLTSGPAQRWAEFVYEIFCWSSKSF